MRWSRRARAAVGVTLVVVFGVAACQPSPGPVSALGTPDPSAPVSASPSVTPLPVDPLETATACGLAVAATDNTITTFLDKSAAQELAIAQGDNATALELAEEIDVQFAGLAEAFTDLGKGPIDPGLRDRLTRTATALTEMSSDYYTGFNYEVHVKLLEFRAGLADTCAPLAVSASPTAGLSAAGG
jgi:hypothetical protein